MHMHIILVVLHKLLQRIVRSNSNRSNFFNNFIINRQISTTRLFRKLRETKFIWLTIEFNRNLTFLAIYYSSTSAEEGPTKDNREKLSCTEPSTRKLVGYFTFPQRTSTSLTIPTGEIVCLFARWIVTSMSPISHG